MTYMDYPYGCANLTALSFGQQKAPRCCKHPGPRFTSEDDMNEKDLARFHAKIQRSESCHLWAARKDREGYGQFWLNGRQLRAHRLAFELAFGPVPDGKLVMHVCDNPSCVNPAHLRAGSTATNIADRNAKARQARGEKQGHSKLTEVTVRECFARAANGEKLKDIARYLGVARSAVSMVLTGKNWAHLGLVRSPPLAPGGSHG